MKPKGSLPHLQGPATCPYPQPVQSSPCSPSHFLKTYFNIIFPTPRSSKATSFPQVSPPKPCMHLSCLLYVPLRITIISSSLTYKIDTDVSQYFFFFVNTEKALPSERPIKFLCGRQNWYGSTVPYNLLHHPSYKQVQQVTPSIAEENPCFKQNLVLWSPKALSYLLRKSIGRNVIRTRSFASFSFPAATSASEAMGTGTWHSADRSGSYTQSKRSWNLRGYHQSPRGLCQL